MDIKKHYQEEMNAEFSKVANLAEQLFIKFVSKNGSLIEGAAEQMAKESFDLAFKFYTKAFQQESIVRETTKEVAKKYL